VYAEQWRKLLTQLAEPTRVGEFMYESRLVTRRTGQKWLEFESRLAQQYRRGGYLRHENAKNDTLNTREKDRCLGQEEVFHIS
jgi:hypothetical protein